nr:NUDIX domain-containing protein [Desulfobacula sp.]
MDTHPPPPLRQASTVILVREKNLAFEVYLLRRSNASGFMDGLYVFPGGVVDPEDKGLESWAPYVDLDPAAMEQQLGGTGFSGEDVLSFSIAAIRETLEEAGVLIALTENRAKTDLDQICAFRLNKDLPKSWFRVKIMAEKWTLSLSSLAPWSHWITPALMKKRFDTRFFIVSMPQGQTCIPDDTETHQGIWLTPQKALEQNLELSLPLSPPTVVTLTGLSAYKSFRELQQVIRTRTWGDPISPCLVPSPDGPLILEPWDPLWGSGEKVDMSGLQKKSCPRAPGFHGYGVRPVSGNPWGSDSRTE